LGFDRPTANVEISRSARAAPHCGQWGAASSARETKASYRTPHATQRYSKIGIAITSYDSRR
jgi:hypothetical protein